MRLKPEVGLLREPPEKKCSVICINIVKSQNYMENHSKLFVLPTKNTNLLMDLLKYLVKFVLLKKNFLVWQNL